MNVYDYIDSKDIREYNQRLQTEFTPIEQAVLVYHSRLLSVDKKLTVWKELSESVSGKDKAILSDTVKAYKTALEHISDTSGVVFEACLYESDFPDKRRYYYFSSYEKAFLSLRNEKDFYLNCEDLYDKKTEGIITLKKLDTDDDKENISYIFNDSLKMVRIETSETEIGCLESCFVNVPLPFKKGDVVRIIHRNSFDRLIVCDMPGSEKYSAILSSRDMRIILKRYGIINGAFGEITEEYPFLDIEYSDNSSKHRFRIKKT